MLKAKPYVIARALHKGGSYDEALSRASSPRSDSDSVTRPGGHEGRKEVKQNET